MITPAQREEVLRLLEEGQPLPVDYKHVLFPPERQEYELVYADKQPEQHVLAETMALPLQRIREFGDTSNGEANSLIFGDNMQAMKALLRMKSAGQLRNPDGTHGFKLIYLDPPFATKRDFTNDTEERAYADKIVGAQFVEFLRRRLIFMRELLTDDGSIYVHLDEKKSHYIKVVMDEVFGEHRFQREIIWRIGWLSGYKTKARNWIRNHDVILFYSRDPNTFNKRYIPYAPGYVRRDGKPPTGEGYPYEDTWNCYEVDQLDSIQIKSFSTEKTGFPTQKNEALVARIIEASSKPGEWVLDPFVGSGTSVAVAEKLGRRWVGIDSAKVAIYTVQRRLLNLNSEIGNTGSPLQPRPFTLFNSGIYDFQRLRDLPWDEWRAFCLSLFECTDKPHKVGGVTFDGARQGYDVIVFDHTLGGGSVLDHGYIESLHSQVGSRVGETVFLIAPAASVAFLEDYLDIDGTRYYVLRIPYSIINELHIRDFEFLRQPVDETQINRTVESVGFDFIRQPSVEAAYSRVATEDGDLLKVAVRAFESQPTKLRTTLEGRDALSMVLVDCDYGQTRDALPDAAVAAPFQLDAAFYGGELKANDWTFAIPASAVGKRLMIIYVDVYGNEHTEVRAATDFGSEGATSPTRVAVPRKARPKSKSAR